MPKPSIKTIKAIVMPRYEVRLVQLENGSYCLAYKTNASKDPVLGEATYDFHMASFLFDNKVQELDGN